MLRRFSENTFNIRNPICIQIPMSNGAAEDDRKAALSQAWIMRFFMQQKLHEILIKGQLTAIGSRPQSLIKNHK